MLGRNETFRILSITSATVMILCAAAGAETAATHDHAMHSHDMHSTAMGSAPRSIASEILSDATVTFVCCSYTPSSVTINVGESVTWSGDFKFHPLAQVDGPESDTEVPGGFASSSGTIFTHTFTTPGTYYYACLFHGVFGGSMRGDVTVNPSVSVPDGADTKAVRLTISPNPAFTTSTVTFSLPRAMATEVAIYDLSGARVSTLQHGMLPAGDQRIAWNGLSAAGKNVGSGIYFVRLTGERLRVQVKLVKIR